LRVNKSDPERRTMDGITFDSIAEMQRYADLKLQQRAGLIRELKHHTKFDLRVNGIHICFYSADFSYIDNVSSRAVLEDVKGFKRGKRGKLLPRVNREFHIKQKLMKAVFGLEVEIV
jgi:hypothetical protein